jgi:hypothetical protein
VRFFLKKSVDMDFCRWRRKWRISAISRIAATRESREILDFPAVFLSPAKRPAGTGPAGLANAAIQTA